MKLSAVTLDCADPLELATFYQEITGLPAHPDSTGQFLWLTGPDGFSLGFQRVDGYQPPNWPGQGKPQQLHLDFTVADLDAAEALVLELGATKPVVQPGDRYRVFIDPAGHPFCITL
ncbi:VOC family protein [Pseudonocardiaceae bacterium YIM PH 21723]|nr:VOC family protein [Pseudonocardiaceae bacterium YIM PH 21723]